MAVLAFVGDHVDTCFTPAGECIGCAVSASGRNSPDLDAPSAAGFMCCQVNALILYLGFSSVGLTCTGWVVVLLAELL